MTLPWAWRTCAMTRARLNPSYERCYLDKKWAGARGDTARARATQTPSQAARLRRTASAVLTTLYSSTTRRRAQRLAAPAWVGSRQPAAQRSRSRRSGRACGATQPRVPVLLPLLLLLLLLLPRPLCRCCWSCGCEPIEAAGGNRCERDWERARATQRTSQAGCRSKRQPA